MAKMKEISFQKLLITTIMVKNMLRKLFVTIIKEKWSQLPITKKVDFCASYHRFTKFNLIEILMPTFEAVSVNICCLHLFSSAQARKYESDCSKMCWISPALISFVFSVVGISSGWTQINWARLTVQKSVQLAYII